MPTIYSYHPDEPHRNPISANQEATNHFEVRRDQFVITTDPAKLDIDVIYDFLAYQSYWAKGRPLQVVQKTIQHSLCFGLFDQAHQVGFARVVTDYATFAWLCDVFVLESHRGLGLGKWLVETIVAHPELHGLRRMILITTSAHGLYHGYGGFEPLSAPEKWMERFNP